ncbi:uncharacterized protein LOC130014940 [Mercurialis annua]|uniref:uncharacterized protein LOC130014940 n=1 Tax=Mercurialis annua TaxID=3986 RepID=UPI0024AFCDF3|nr:uncharacterized protein LOC130014940 [Mercurialis annua]
MDEPMADEGTVNDAQFKPDMATYTIWKKKDSTARGILISSMDDDLMYEYQRYSTTNAMWAALREKFGGTTVSRLRQLTIKFDTYKKVPNKTMKQHLRDMSNMIMELKSAGHNLTNEQQVQAVIRSLPNNWEHMKVNMTHNENIKTFSDIARHLKLEDERLEAAKPDIQAYVAESNFKQGGHKRKWSKKSWKNKGKMDAAGPGPKGGNKHQKRGGK